MNSVIIRGVITRVQGKDHFIYSVHDGASLFEFSSRIFVQAGEGIIAHCKKGPGKGTTLVADEIKTAPEVYFEVESKISSSLVLSDAIEEDPCLRGMRPFFEAVCRKLHAAKQLNRFVMAKFHGDADGIISALIISKFLAGEYCKQGAAVYGIPEARKDMEKMGQQPRPLLLLLDFGSGQESAGSLAMVKFSGIEIISIDHHPPFPDSAKSLSLGANSWNACDNGSDYPTGLLCSRIASMLGFSSDGLERIACAGDRSPLIFPSSDERKKALALDYSATYAPYGSGLKPYSDLLSSPSLLDSITLQANSKLEETALMIKRAVKSQFLGGIKVCVFNLDSIAERGEFPTRGKIVGIALETLDQGKPLMAIGWGKRSVIFRLNDGAVEKGAKADEIIRHVKTSLVDFIENGGGHSRAAALRIKEGYEAIALDAILAYIGSGKRQGGLGK